MISKVIIETQYLPTIAFYGYYFNFETLILEQNENYQKGGFRNRASILSSQGPLTLSVPLQKGKNNQLPIRKVQIDYTTDWIKLHLATLQTCYGKSAFAEHYFPQLEAIYKRKPLFLFELNLQFITLINKWLNITHEIEFTDMYRPFYENEAIDKRNFISPKSKNIKNLNQDFTFAPYEQVFSENRIFYPNLSILDLLFTQGPEAAVYLRMIYKNQ